MECGGGFDQRICLAFQDVVPLLVLLTGGGCLDRLLKDEQHDGDARVDGLGVVVAKFEV